MNFNDNQVELKKMTIDYTQKQYDWLDKSRLIAVGIQKRDNK